MFTYRRGNRAYVAIKRRAFYGSLVVLAAVWSAHIAYTASLSIRLDDAHLQLELQKRQSSTQELLIPPQKSAP